MSRLFFGSIAFGLLLTGCSPTSKTVPDPRIQVQTVQVVPVLLDSGHTRTFSGTVESRVQSNLGFRVGGKITERLVRVGQHVKKNQVLMRLDTKDLSLQLVSANKAIESAKADLYRAKNDQERKKKLVKKGYVSSQEYDDALATLNSNKAQLAMAEASASIAKNATQYSELVADTDGVVISTDGEPGQVVAEGQTVLTLAKDGARDAVISLPETIHPKLGATARVSFFDNKFLPQSASLREISNSADSVTRTYTARFQLNDIKPQPLLGSTVNVTLMQPSDRRDVLVPIGALFDDGHGAGVWVLNQKTSKVALRHVTIKRMTVELASIVGDLKPGDLIVAMGAHHLYEDQTVKTILVK
ncbi:efflux RND transporter periplasmic adaptor subunit [Vibrio profundum]|uniref:efflux RND transporter periplasmic adaptor subunit n=1 Tax=Vibrio profundum TaxID=2910247 RepID=UPI003D13B363